MSQVVAIVQARMGSERLPGKVMKPLAGYPMVEQVLRRVLAMTGIDQVVLATTDRTEDDALANYILQVMQSRGVELFRGDALDVLDRYYQAARTFSADIILRFTADCPFLSPQLSSAILKDFNHDPQTDYLSNTLERTFPHGLDTEIFRFSALEKAWKEARDPAEREHVTPFVWRRPKEFKLRQFLQKDNHSDFRLTVDTPEDFALAEKIYQRLFSHDPLFEWPKVVEVLESDPQLRTINSHIRQKPL